VEERRTERQGRRESSHERCQSLHLALNNGAIPFVPVVFDPHPHHPHHPQVQSSVIAINVTRCPPSVVKELRATWTHDKHRVGALDSGPESLGVCA
jgi:hypothetical protein